MVRLYAHLDTDGLTCTLPVEVEDPLAANFAQVKKRFLEYAVQNQERSVPKYEECCFYNGEQRPIADASSVATFIGGDNDFFLRSLPTRDSALGANIRAKKDLSYYYAHDRPLVSKAADSQSKATVRGPVTGPPAEPGRNMRQSPFGTDVLKYESLTSYSWEDANKTTVKVSVPFDGVGALGNDAVKCNFGVRQFEVLIQGPTKCWRFACSKTHAEMIPEEASFNVRANRITLKLRKAKDEEVWFDLFKKKAIGDNDPP